MTKSLLKVSAAKCRKGEMSLTRGIFRLIREILRRWGREGVAALGYRAPAFVCGGRDNFEVSRVEHFAGWGSGTSLLMIWMEFNNPVRDHSNFKPNYLMVDFEMISERRAAELQYFVVLLYGLRRFAIGVGPHRRELWNITYIWE